MSQSYSFSWRPIIDDLSPYNWVMVICYFLLAVTSHIIYSRNVTEPNQKVWIVTTLLFIFFGVNKLFSLKELIAECGRILLVKTGIYGFRRPVLFGASIIASLCAVEAFNHLITKNKFLPRGYMVVVAGIFYLFGYFMIRSISFHRVDRYIEHTFYLGIKLKFILEFIGIIITMCGCVRVFIPITIKQ